MGNTSSIILSAKNNRNDRNNDDVDDVDDDADGDIMYFHFCQIQYQITLQSVYFNSI